MINTSIIAVDSSGYMCNNAGIIGSNKRTSVMNMALKYKSKYHHIISGLNRLIIKVYGENLVSIVYFGSVARDRFRPGSDIDFLIVSENLQYGRMKRVGYYHDNIEPGIMPVINETAKQGIHVELSPIFKTKAEVKNGSPLFLDMVEDSIISYDRDDFFSNYLSGLKSKLEKLGAQKIVRGSSWYWKLKPDYRHGDIIDL